MEKPVILLAFADYRTDEDLHLRELGAEQQLLKKQLELASERELCDFDIIPNANVTEIINHTLKYGERLVAFHFSGHADGYRLMLSKEAEGSAYAEGLGAFFKEAAPNLKIIFLNGCSTQSQVDHFLEHGIPLVIATDQAVRDDIARDLSVHFYSRLGEGQSIQLAFRSYEHILKTNRTAVRGLYKTNQGTDSRFPWDIYPKQGATAIRNWSLAKARGDCLFFLPPLPESIHYPKQPYKNLQPYAREDARIFFGRSCLIKDLYDSIRDETPGTSPILLFFGQSGVGKSSLLQAGLLPRIEEQYQVITISRSAKEDLTTTLLATFSVTDIAAWKDKWLALEKERPILLIVDQLEEVFTNPIEHVPDELAKFANLLQSLYTTSESLKGKVLLSFREEYLARLENELTEILPFHLQKFFVDRLNWEEIMEAIEGPAQQYNINIDSELPEIIAAQLIADQASAIAPVLQILLNKMWMEARHAATHTNNIQFSEALFYQLGSQGTLLRNFVKEKLASLKIWNAPLVDSGLALDFLFFHTTGYSTSKSRPIAELTSRYDYQSSHNLQELIVQLKDQYLLSSFTTSTTPPIPHTRLSHDVLAPIIRQQYNESTRPGQTAARLIHSKLETGKDFIPFNKQELAMVDAGAQAMRRLEPEEKEFIEASRRKVRKAQNRRRLLLGLIGIAGLLLLGSGFLLFNFRREQQANQLMATGQELELHNPTLAFKKIKEGLALDPNDYLKQKEQYRMYREHVFAKPVFLASKDSSIIRELAISPNGEWLACTYQGDTRNDVFLFHQNQEGQYEINKQLTGPENTLYQLSFSHDHSYLLGGGADHRIHVWNINKGGTSTIQFLEPREKNRIEALHFSMDDRWLVAGDHRGRVYAWERNGQQLKPLFQVKVDEVAVEQIVVHPNGQFLLAGGSNGLWKINRVGTKEMILESAIQALAIDAEGKQIAVGIGKEVELYALTPTSFDLQGRFAHPHAIETVVFSPDNQLVLSTSGKVAWLWAIFDPVNPLRFLRGHEQDIREIFFNDDITKVWSLDEGGQILEWDLPYDIPFQTINRGSGFAVEQVQFSPEYLIASLRDSLLLFDHNDLNYKGAFTGHQYARIVDLYGSASNEKITSLDESGRLLSWIPGNSTTEEIKLPKLKIESVVATDANGLLIHTHQNALFWRQSMDQIYQLNGHTEEINTLALSADGKRGLSSDLKGNLLLWDLTRKELGHSWSHPGRQILDITFTTPKSFTIATNSDSLFFYTLGEAPIVKTIPGEQSLKVRQILWSKDRTYYLLLLSTGAVQLYSKAGFLIKTFKDEESPLCIALDPTEQYLAGGFPNGQIKIWRNDRLPLPY